MLVSCISNSSQQSLVAERGCLPGLYTFLFMYRRMKDLWCELITNLRTKTCWIFEKNRVFVVVVRGSKISRESYNHGPMGVSCISNLLQQCSSNMGFQYYLASGHFQATKLLICSLWIYTGWNIVNFSINISFFFSDLWACCQCVTGKKVKPMIAKNGNSNKGRLLSYLTIIIIVLVSALCLLNFRDEIRQNSSTLKKAFDCVDHSINANTLASDLKSNKNWLRIKQSNAKCK